MASGAEHSGNEIRRSAEGGIAEVGSVATASVAELRAPLKGYRYEINSAESYRSEVRGFLKGC